MRKKVFGLKIHQRSYILVAAVATLLFVVTLPVHAIDNEVTYTGLNSNIYGDDGHGGGQKGPFDIGFDFRFFDTQYTTGNNANVNVNINGALTFGGYYTAFSNGPLSSSGQNDTIFPFWDDLTCYSSNNNAIYYATVGEAPNRKFIVQWTNVYFYNTSIQMGTFQAILYEGSNDIQLQYRDLLGGDRALGNSATIGIKKNNSTFHQYSNNTASLSEGQAIRYSHDGVDNYTVNNNAAYDPVYLIPAGAPISPVLVNPTDGTTGITNTPTFEWLPVEGAASYVVLISTVSNFSSTVVNQSGITGTSYTHGSPLNANTQYYWRVQSVNNVGSSLSATRTFTTAAVANSPPEISNIGASLYTNGDLVTQTQLMNTPLSMILSDSDDGQQVRYRLQISKQANFSDLVIDYRSPFIDPGEATYTLGQVGGSYLVGAADTMLDPEANYYLRIRAEDEAAASSSWAGPEGVAFVLQEEAANSAPDTTNLGPSNVVNGEWLNGRSPAFSFDLSDEDDDELAYRIQVSNQQDFDNVIVDYTSSYQQPGNRSFVVGQDTMGGSYAQGSQGQQLNDGEYYWRVKAIDENAGESSYILANSGDVAFRIDATPPTTPGQPDLSGPISDTPEWTWQESVDNGSGLNEHAYRIEWSQQSSFSTYQFAQTNTNVYVHSDKLTGGQWFIRVRAIDNADNQSAYSVVTSIVIPVSDDDGDGIPDPIENAAPNNGDANNDGILDSLQANVASFKSVENQQYAVIEVSSSCSLASVESRRGAMQAVQDSGFDYPAGLVAFTAMCNSPGYTTTVKVYHYNIDTSGLSVRKYNPNTNAYFNLTGAHNATVQETSIDGMSVIIASYQITDGDGLDTDNIINGIIVDPVGFGRPKVGTPNTGISRNFLDLVRNNGSVVYNNKH